MKKEALSQFGHPDLILFGFLLFFASFVLMVLWVFNKSRKSVYEEAARLPLEDSPIKNKVKES